MPDSAQQTQVEQPSSEILPSRSEALSSVVEDRTVDVMGLIKFGLQQGQSPESMQGLYEIFKAERNDARRTALVRATSEVQGRCPKPKQNRHVHYASRSGSNVVDYTYADLESILDALAPCMNEFGLTTRFNYDTKEVGGKLCVTVTCIVEHVDGKSFECCATVPLFDMSGKLDSTKSYEATCTICRRVALVSAFNLVSTKVPQDMIDEESDGPIDAQQLEEVNDLIRQLGDGINMVKFRECIGHNRVKDLQRSQFARIMSMLRAKLKSMSND